MLRNLLLRFAVTTTLLLCGNTWASVQRSTATPKFRADEWQVRFVRAWESRDLGKISGLYSRIYANAGDSREDTLADIAKLLRQRGRITCRYRILSSRQFSDSNLASVKYVLELSRRDPNGGSPQILTQTMGYFSLIYEQGRWRIYATQFFCDPRIPTFDFDQEQGDWPSFDRQIQLVSYDPARPASDARWLTAFTQPIVVPVANKPGLVPFDKRAWEQRVMDGWNRRDASVILSTFSRLYNEVGVSRSEAIQPVTGFFDRFSKLDCRYRVLGFRQFPGTELASVKAVMEMTGVPTGGRDPVMLIQTMGYASLIYEDGQWRMYASQLFYFPKVPHFNFEKEAGNWPSWGTVVDLKPY